MFYSGSCRTVQHGGRNGRIALAGGGRRQEFGAFALLCAQETQR
jgi:hypothetical protein